MRRPNRTTSRLTPTALALWANAAAMLLVAGALLGRGGGPSLPDFPSVLPAAYGQQQPMPIAGGGGFFLMPAQFSRYAWGCYVMDVDAQTLSAYKFDPAATELRLVAARYFGYDRRLKNFNSPSPSPEDVRKILDKLNDNGGANQAPPGMISPSGAGGGTEEPER